MTEEAVLTEETSDDVAARLARIEAELEAARQRERELKETVITTARKYAVQHNLCTVVDQALEEAGLGPKYVGVELSLNIPAKVELQVDETFLEGMTEEQKTDYVARQISDALLLLVDAKKATGLIRGNVGVGGGPRHRIPDPKVTLGSIMVEGIGELPPPPPRPYNPPTGYEALYCPEGRVLHFVVIGRRGYTTSLCGNQASHNWRSNSARGEGRVCGRCQRSAESL